MDRRSKVSVKVELQINNFGLVPSGNIMAEVDRFKSVLIGEALVGDGLEVAHIDRVIGLKGSSMEQAFISALASPAQGHTPFLALLEPNLRVKPSTFITNKVAIKDVQ